jgi:IMP dehydrogenase
MAEGDTRVADVMTSPVETIGASASVREATTVMRENGFNALLVPGRDTGIVTSTDVLDVVVEGQDPGTTTVEDVMTAPVESVTGDLRLGEAAAMMTNYGINHLPVIGDDRDYVGMVSSTDLRETLV